MLREPACVDTGGQAQTLKDRHQPLTLAPFDPILERIRDLTCALQHEISPHRFDAISGAPAA
jgi:hypothetical protein